MKKKSRNRREENWHEIRIQKNQTGKYAIILGEKTTEFCYDVLIKNSTYLVARKRNGAGVVYHKTAGELTRITELREMAEQYIIATVNNGDQLIIKDEIIEGVVAEKVRDSENNCYGFLVIMKEGIFKISIDGKKTKLVQKWKDIQIQKKKEGPSGIFIKLNEKDNLVIPYKIENGKLYDMANKEQSFADIPEITISTFSIEKYWFVGQYLCLRDKETKRLYLYDRDGREIRSQEQMDFVKVSKADGEIYFSNPKGKNRRIEIYDMVTFNLLLKTECKAIFRLKPEEIEFSEATPLWYAITETGPFLVSKKNRYMLTSNCDIEEIEYIGNYIYNRKDNILYYLSQDGEIKPIITGKIKREVEYQEVLFGNMLVRYYTDIYGVAEYSIYLEDIPVVENKHRHKTDLHFEQIPQIYLKQFRFVPLINRWFYFDISRKRAYSCFHPIYWINWMKQKMLKR